MNRPTRLKLMALSHNEELSERLRREIRIELVDFPALPSARTTHERSL